MQPEKRSTAVSWHHSAIPGDDDGGDDDFDFPDNSEPLTTGTSWTSSFSHGWHVVKSGVLRFEDRLVDFYQRRPVAAYATCFVILLVLAVLIIIIVTPMKN